MLQVERFRAEHANSQLRRSNSGRLNRKSAGVAPLSSLRKSSIVQVVFGAAGVLREIFGGAILRSFCRFSRVSALQSFTV